VTAAAYRGKTADLAEIGQRYDVHFAVVGNGRRQSGRLIVSASVYDIARGKPVWTQHFDLPDGPGSQSQLVQNIYENYWQTSNDLEASWAISDHPGRLDAHDLALILLSTRLSTPTRDHYLDKMALAARILALDPNNRQGLERQARLHAEFVMLGYSADPASDLALAEQASDRLLAIDPNHLLTLRARTKVLLAKGDWPEAEAAVRRTIEIQPTEAMRHYELGIILMAEARPQEALQSLEDAKRFAGGSDPIYLFDARIAMAEVAIGRFADAIAAARASISGFPPDADRAAELPWLALIAATSNSGQGDAAREKLQRFLAAPRAGSNMAAIRNWPLLAADPNLLNGLRAAGMPDETAQP
jgi:adenylate cyclase